MSLKTFTDAYKECALWSSTDDSGEPLDGMGFEFEVSTGKQMEDDCRDFYDSHFATWRAADMNDEQAGRDFWLTRNGHGAGFWDRGIGEAGEQLTEAAKVYGGVDLFLGENGEVYA